MKELLGYTYAQFTRKFKVKPKKHLYHPEERDGYSLFVRGNEFLFVDGRLTSVEIQEFSTAQRIPGFIFPIADSLERTLAKLTRQKFRWEVYSKYSREQWVVIRLPEHWILYEYEFAGRKFQLSYLRLEVPSSWEQHSAD